MVLTFVVQGENWNLFVLWEGGREHLNPLKGILRFEGFGLRDY